VNLGTYCFELDFHWRASVRSSTRRWENTIWYKLFIDGGSEGMQNFTSTFAPA
jgi:hypothetical protein